MRPISQGKAVWGIATPSHFWDELSRQNLTRKFRDSRSKILKNKVFRYFHLGVMNFLTKSHRKCLTIVGFVNIPHDWEI